VYGKNDVRDLFLRSFQVGGLDGFFVNYPEHFLIPDPETIISFIKNNNIRVFGLNLRFPESQFSMGAFTNPDKNTRQAAIDLCKKAIDTCIELGGNHVSLWLGYDGIDYPLQADYSAIWKYEEEGLNSISEYAKDLHISIEYKPSDPRCHSLLDSIGITLSLISEIDSPNLGVTLDYCHMLMAKEIPALSAVLAMQKNKLFGVHLNDGYGYQDDGLIIGSASQTLTKEFYYYLLKYKYAEPIYFDTFPVREDPILECRMNILRSEEICKQIERDLPENIIASVLASQDSMKSIDLLGEKTI
jgi:xylose isomerase